MRTWLEWLQRLRGTFRRRRTDRDLEAELRLHLELAAEDAARRGDSEAARRAARLRAGGVAQAMEALRDQRGLRWLDDLGRDLRHAIRALGRSPGFTAVALLTLALGIGANTAIFSVLRAVWIGAVPFHDPGTLVILTIEAEPVTPGSAFGIHDADASRWRSENRTFSGLEGALLHGVQMDTAAGPQPIRAIAAASGLFDLLGMRPLLGRGLLDDDFRPGPATVVVLGHGFWIREYGGDPAIVDTTLTLTDGVVTIVGVMPPEARLHSFEPDVWLPLTPAGRPVLGAPPDRRSGPAMMVGRLRPGVPLEAARSDILSLGVSGAYESPSGTGQLRLVPLRDRVVGSGIGPSLYLLFAATGLVLAMACTNVAMLLLTWGVVRGQEMAVRLAIGARRTHIVRQVFLEGAILAAAGGIAAVAVAWLARDALVAAIPASVPRTEAIAIDAQVLAFALLASGLAVVAIGMVPAWRVSSVHPASALTAGPPIRPAGHQLDGLLVAGEAATSVVVVACAVLLVTSFVKLNAIDLGYEANGVAAFRVVPPLGRDVPPAVVPDVLDVLGGTPGVISAAAVDWVPPASIHQPAQTAALARLETTVTLDVRFVSPGYFDVLGMRLLDGRDFTQDDRSTGAISAILNQRAAHLLWGTAPAVGEPLQIGLMSYVRGTVVGVVNDIHGIDRTQEPLPRVYLPIRGAPVSWSFGHSPTFVIRLAERHHPPLEQLQVDIERVSGLPVPAVNLLDADMARAIHTPRFRAWLFGLLGLLVLLLTGTGVFGLTSRAVAHRRREMGIRIAVGAEARDVIGRTMRRALAPVAIGAGLGLAAALGITRLIAHFLYDTEATDPLLLAMAVALLLATAAVASWVPSRGAVRINPVEVLRVD